MTRYVRNILFLVDCQENGRWPALSGTCFLFCYHKKFYVITAKHALHDFDINDIKILLNPYAADIRERHRTIAFSGAFSFNGDSEKTDYDSDADDICIFEVDQREPEALLSPHFTEYVRPDNISANAEMFVVGYPNKNQYIDYDKNVGEFGAIILPVKKYSDSNLHDFKFQLYVEKNIYPDFDGFSGAPVFYKKPDGNLRVIGIVLRGSAKSGIFHCLDIRRVEAFILTKHRNVELSIRPCSKTFTAQ